MSLKPVFTALEKIARESSRKQKEYLIQEAIDCIGPDFENTILFALDAYRQFNVTTVNYMEGQCSAEDTREIFNYLGMLATQRSATNIEKTVLSRLSSFDSETVEVVRRIINKDLRCGVGVKTAAKFVPGVKEYGVLKPQTDKKTLLQDWEKFVALAGGYGNICWSIKVDGVRICDCVVHEDGEVQYFSTNGKLYQNFHCFNEEVIALASHVNRQSEGLIKYPVHFDGEVISYDGNFQSVVTQTQREYDVKTDNLRFLIWSVVCPGPFEERYNYIWENLPTVRRPARQRELIGPKAVTNVFCLTHIFEHDIRCWKDVELLSRQVIAEGEEGLVFKVADHEHVRKRSRIWFRTKALYLQGTGIEVDLQVLRAEKGTGKFSEMMGCLVCDYNGQEVNVGGGYTEAQRKSFLEKPPKWITVNADSETNDGSLRFPQFVREREEK